MGVREGESPSSGRSGKMGRVVWELEGGVTGVMGLEGKVSGEGDP